MGAPKENQFWKLMSTHGRDKLFATPELFMEACKEYFNWVDSHPWYKVEQLKKPYEETYTAPGGEKKKRWVTLAKVPTARPYTIQGLCIYLDCNSVWFNQFETATQAKINEDFKKKDGKEYELAKGFSKILTHVREIIYQQKLEGAAVGAFNASIIQRDLGLRDNQDVKLSNPEGETFRTDSKVQHEVVFKRMSDKNKDDSTSEEHKPDVQ